MNKTHVAWTFVVCLMLGGYDRAHSQQAAGPDPSGVLGAMRRQPNTPAQPTPRLKDGTVNLCQVARLPVAARRFASKMPVIWNYLSVMTCDPTARADGDNDGLRIPVVGARDPDVVVDREHRFEVPSTR